jgi:hypothetical protein
MLNFLTGDRSLRRVRDRGRQFAQELYDPNVFAPQRQMASRQATMGIDQGGIRSGALAQLSRIDNDADIFGGSAGRMVGMMGQQNLAQGRNITDMETRLGIADQQARLQGQQQLAEVQSRQLQTGAMRDAAMTEADMMYQAERSSRRQALAGTAIGLGTMGAMGKFKGLQSLLGTLTSKTPATPRISTELNSAFTALDYADPDFDGLMDFTPELAEAISIPRTNQQPSATPPILPPPQTPSATDPLGFTPIGGLPVSTERPRAVTPPAPEQFTTPDPISFKPAGLFNAIGTGFRSLSQSEPGRTIETPVGGAIERGLTNFAEGIADMFTSPFQEGAMTGVQTPGRQRQAELTERLNNVLNTIDVNDEQQLTSIRNSFIRLGYPEQQVDRFIQSFLNSRR